MLARRRLAALAIAPVLAATAVIASPPAAQADTRGCVTKAEYKKVKKGMKIERVHRVFDTAGKKESRAASGGYVFMVRSYKVCNSRWSAVAVGFEKSPGTAMKLSAKNAVWVS